MVLLIKVLEVWNEWSQSTIGSNQNTLHSEVFCGAVISALAMNGRADDAEKIFNTQPLTDKTNEIMLFVIAHCIFTLRTPQKGNLIP